MEVTMSYPKVQRVGAPGGTIDCGDGFSLQIPANALSSNVEFTIDIDRTSERISGYTQLSYKRSLEPENQTFKRNITINFPYDIKNPTDLNKVKVGYIDPLGWLPTDPTTSRARATTDSFDTLKVICCEQN